VYENPTKTVVSRCLSHTLLDNNDRPFVYCVGLAK
jgi:hypothetical protein